MKKKIVGATFMVAMMAMVGYNAHVNQTKTNMSELALANVEALADDGEGATTKRDGTLYATGPDLLDNMCCCPGDDTACTELKYPSCSSKVCG